MTKQNLAIIKKYGEPVVTDSEVYKYSLDCKNKASCSCCAAVTETGCHSYPNSDVIQLLAEELEGCFRIFE